MNLVEQIFEQARIGSGHHGDNAFLSGMQVGQQQQRIELEKQRVAADLAQLPLQLTLKRQESELNQYSLAHALEQQQSSIEAKQAIAEFAPLASQYFKEDKPEALMGVYMDVIAKHPDAQDDPVMAKYPAMIETSIRAKQIGEHYKQADAARMEAAKNSQFRSLPAGVKIDRLLQQAQSDLADAQDPLNPDPVLAKDAQDRIASLTAQKQLETDKLKVQQDKVLNEANRIKALEARTKVTEQRTQYYMKRLGDLDSKAMQQKIKVIQDDTKLSSEDKLDKIDEIHREFELKAKRQERPLPTASAPTATTPAFRLGTVINQGGKRYIYQGGDPKDPSSYVEAR